MQSKTHSIIEVCCSTAFGFLIAYLSQVLIFPLYGIHTSHATNLQITAWFTLISVLRSYLFRRLFNSLAGKRRTFNCTLCGSNTHTASVCPWAIGCSIIAGMMQTSLIMFVFWLLSGVLKISADWNVIIGWCLVLTSLASYFAFYIISRVLHDKHKSEGCQRRA